MNFKFLTFLIGVVLIGVNSFSQNFDTTFWRNKANFIQVNEEEYSVGDAIILEDNRWIKYTRQGRFITRHKITHIKTQEGLDNNNKVRFYVSEEGDIEDIRARSIGPDGTIIELNQNNIKQVDDVSDETDLKIFAIEGAQVHGQIEYSYTYKSPLYDSGLERFSMDYPTRHAFTIIQSFKGLEIDSKSFNGSAKEQKAETVHFYDFSNIDPIADEKYATPRANRVFVDYKLIGTSSSRSPYAYYTYLVKHKYDQLTDFNATEERKANSILRKIKKSKGESEIALENVKNVVEYLKKNYVYENSYGEEFTDVMSIFRSGAANDLGLAKIYCLLFDEMGVKYQIIYTNNKYDFWVDEKYCSRYMFDEYLLYLPDENVFIYPASETIQFGLVPSWIVGNNGMVIGNDTYFSFIEVPSQHPDTNLTSMDIIANIDPLEGKTSISIDQFGTGQVAFDMNYDIFYAESEEEKEEELMNLVDWRYPKCEVKSIEMIDPEKWGDCFACKDISCKRALKAEVESNSMYEDLGDKLLFKIGDLIGPQTELYSAHKRVQKITCSYNKSYRFHIEVNIPEGYKYVGEQNANIENSFKDMDDNYVAGFKSELKEENGKVIVDIYEFYARINIDIAYYEDYRRIINSAADFNKATLMFEKI